MRVMIRTVVMVVTVALGSAGLVAVTAGAAQAEPVIATGFESGLDGWEPRSDADGPPEVATTTEVAYEGSAAAAITGRTSQGDGLQRDITGVLEPGTTYSVTAWARFADGEPPASVWLSVARTSGGTTSYDTLAQTEVSDTWTKIEATYQLPLTDDAVMYVETAYPDGSSADFYLDSVSVEEVQGPEIQDLPPLQDTLEVPFGAAVDSRETVGAAADLLTRHFNQITPENHMKPDYWYDADRQFGIDPEAQRLMEFAQEQSLGLYGHTLLWHQQNPDWFFQRDDGTELTDSPADREFLTERLRTHIFGVAEALSTGGGYGRFGSDDNPVVAFDVVNEVISDGAGDPEGMRQSRWYEILGEDYVALAFRFAEEAFNEEFAAPGAERPVSLYINDYSTENADKLARLRALVERLLAEDVPVDGVGHQFHIFLGTPVSDLEAAIDDLTDLGLEQAATELDISALPPVTQASLIEQGQLYRDVFAMLRQKDLFSITVWGLSDNRSWRATNEPLVFDGDLQAKPAYDGVAGNDLPVARESATVFAGTIRPEEDNLAAPRWELVPAVQVGEIADLRMYWRPDRLSVRGTVTDRSRERADRVVFTVGDETFVLRRSGYGDIQAAVGDVPGGWRFAATVPLPDVTELDTLDFDVAVHDGDDVTSWNPAGNVGELVLVEKLSSSVAVRARQRPSIDGTAERVWNRAKTLETRRVVQGDEGAATAVVRTLWSPNELFVLAEVTDETIDTSAADAYQQDSVELFLDPGNAKNGAYGPGVTQMRISADNEISFGTGDEAEQRSRLTSATTTTEDGYVVEAAIALPEQAQRGTVHGFDVQVNDGTDGLRTGVTVWADPTGLGYVSSARWGALRLGFPGR